MAIYSAQSLVMPDGNEFQFFGKTYFGVCSTAASTQIKEVTIEGFTEESFRNGTIVCISFWYANTHNEPRLNINNLGSPRIYSDIPEGIVQLVYYDDGWEVLGGDGEAPEGVFFVDIDTTNNNAVTPTASEIVAAYNDGKQLVIRIKDFYYESGAHTTYMYALPSEVDLEVQNFFSIRCAACTMGGDGYYIYYWDIVYDYSQDEFVVENYFDKLLSAPSSASAGQVLTYNGSSWGASNAPVQSVNGQTGAVSLTIPTIPTVTVDNTLSYSVMLQNSGTLAPKVSSSVTAGAGQLTLGRNGENTAVAGKLTIINGGDYGRITNLKGSYTGGTSIDVSLPSSAGTLALVSQIPTVASDIGAIPAPSSPSSGNVLTWNGTAWVAQSLPIYDGTVVTNNS